MINLGDKNWGVKDSGLLAYKQVGSKYFNKDFDFTRASNGTYIDKNGVLQTAELYNLVEYSQDFSQWTKSNVAITDNKIGYDGTNHAYLLENTANSGRLLKGTSASGDLTLSLYAKAGNVNWLALYCSAPSTPYVYFDLENGVVGTNFGGNASSTNIEDAGNGWYRCSMTFNTTISDIRIFVAKSDASLGLVGENIYIQDVQLVEGTEARDYQYTNGRVGIPRIDYSDGVGALLLEPQRTNLVTYSEDFESSNWSKTQITIDNNISISPDGNVNASRVNSATAAQNSYAIFTSSPVSGALSYFAKDSGARYFVVVRGTYSDGDYAIFDLEDGVISQNPTYSGTTAEIENYGNGWYRCILYSALSTTVNAFSTSGSGTSLNVLASGTIDIYGAQLEHNATYVTSYIKSNSGSTTTRLADVANNCGSEQDFNSEEGVLYAEILKRQDNNDNYILISINDGSGNDDNSVTIGFDSSNDTYARIQANGTNTLISQDIITNKDEYYKIALKYNSSGDNAFWLNGVEMLSNTTSFTFANALSRLDFAYNSINGLPFYGKVRSVKYFPTALTDDELQNLTT